jgi:predicted ATPase with chaperone activity
MARPFELVETTRTHQADALGALEDGRLIPDEQPHPVIEAPALPITVEDTGLSTKFLGYLVLKVIHVLSLETSADISAHLKLHQSVIEKLLTGLKQQSLVEILGSVSANVPILRYGLTGAGREAAIVATKQCEYIGPAPVTLASYQSQVDKQSISKERVTSQALAGSLAHLVIPRQLIRRLGPAVNSARSLLLYGPSGNGKTSVSEAIARAFTQSIYIPYCIEVDGQIIKIFDPTVHSPVTESPGLIGADGEAVNLFKRKDDPRWVKCRRPRLAVGGELTLDMLDLDFDPISKYYEAPAQVKATGGVFIIDDFGRQLVQPKDLLNRWIVPLEKRVDYLTVHTGMKFEMPFDQLVIFSTNIPPNELMDAAQLRRVKYKLRIDPPQFSEYAKIFRRVCEEHKLDMPEGILSYLLNDFYPKTGSGCAAFHPIFIVEHAMATCRFEGMRPCLTLDLVKDALANLYIHDQDGDLGSQTPAGV